MAAHNTIKFGNSTWAKGFTMVPNHVLEAEGLSSGAKLTFALLMKHGRDKHQAFPGQVRMARYAQCTEKTLRGYIKELQSVGLVIVERRGQGKPNLYILHPERELRQVDTTDLERSPATGQDGLFSTEEEDEGKEDEGKEEDGASAPPDRAQELYDGYQRIVLGNAESQPLTPSLRRTADKALAEFDLPDLLTACRGFVNWRRKKPGDKRFSSVFASHPGGRPLHDHIAFWIENAEGGGASALDGVPSETKVKITRAVVDVQRAFGSEDPDTLASGEQALEFLKSQGIESAEGRDGRPYFPALGGKP